MRPLPAAGSDREFGMSFRSSFLSYSACRGVFCGPRAGSVAIRKCNLMAPLFVLDVSYFYALYRPRDFLSLLTPFGVVLVFSIVGGSEFYTDT